MWIIHPHRYDLVRTHRNRDLVSRYRQRRALRLFHQVGFRRSRRARRNRNGDVAGLPCPLIQVEDERVRVFGLLHRRQHHVARFDRNKRVPRSHFSRVRINLLGAEPVIEVEAMPNRESLPPSTPMRIERVAEVLMPAIRVGIWPGGRPQQRKTQHVAACIVAEFRVVDQAEAVLTISQVGPPLRRNLKARFLPAIVPCGRALNGAERNFKRRLSLEAVNGNAAFSNSCVSCHSMSFFTTTSSEPSARMMSWENFEFCVWCVTRITARIGPFSINSTESAASSLCGGTSYVPGSIFQAS